MIKTFIGHCSAEDQFVDWIGKKLEKDFSQLDIFVDHWSNRPGDYLQKMIEEVKQSFFYIPIISNNFISSEFCMNERIVASKNSHTHEFPIRKNLSDENIPKDLLRNFKAPDDVSGRLWCDFSNEKEWNSNYQELSKAIFDKITELGLLVEEKHYSDLQHIDLILDRETPTNSEFKIIFNIYLKRREFQKYFFHKLENLIWLKYFKIYGFLDSNPDPIKEENEPGFVIPYWPFLDYLEKASLLIKKKRNKGEIIKHLIDIIKNVSINKTDNNRTWWSFVKILHNLPNEEISVQLIEELIPIWLDSRFPTDLQGPEIILKLLPKFLNKDSELVDVAKAEKIIHNILDLEKVPAKKELSNIYKEEEVYKFKIDQYWLNEGFKDKLDFIAEKCSVQVISSIESRIRKILKKHEDGIFYSFYQTSNLYDPLDFLTFLLKSILDKKIKHQKDEVRKILNKYITDNFLYFRKMALYIIGKNTDDFIDLFFGSLDTWIGESNLNDVYFGDELKNVLQNMKIQSKKHKRRLKDLIENGPRYPINWQDRKKFIVAWKQRRYRALSNNQFFKRLYEKYKKITNVEFELKPGIMQFEWRSGSEPSPKTKKEIIQMPNEELAEFLNSFSTKNYWDGPTADGLSDMLKIIVQENPEKFTSNMNPFVTVGYLYIYDIIWGLKDAWKNKKPINWNNILRVIENYIEREDFWEGRFKVKGSHWDADENWVIKQIGELIQEGTKSDDWAFDSMLLPKAEKIILFIIDHLITTQNKKEDDEIKDPNYVLNSTFGNIILALLFLALRKSRIKKKKRKEGESRWAYKDKYEQLFKSMVGEAFTIFGQYMPNFMYLDKSWTRKKIREFEDIDDHEWGCFIKGFLWGNVYLDIYDLIKPHYQRALENDISENQLIRHIVVLYLSDIEKLENGSLINLIVKKSNSSQVDILVRFLRGRFKDMLKEIQTKSREDKIEKAECIRKSVLNLWEAFYHKYKEKQDFVHDDRRVLTDLLMLAIFIPKMTSKYLVWINLSLENLKPHYDGHLFVEDLNLIKGKGNSSEDGKLIGEALLLLVQKVHPSIFKENIKYLVKFIYETKDSKAKEIANKIFEEYAKEGICDDKGDIFLIDLYEKFNRNMKKVLKN